MKNNTVQISKVSDLLKKLEKLQKENQVCLMKSSEIIEKTKNMVLRSSKFL